jgi:hypothetical protein
MKNNNKNNKNKLNKNRGTRGSFSDTTTASFGADFLIGATDGGNTSDALQFGYQMGIGLNTSFTGEDSLNATIDIGSGAINNGALQFDDTSDYLKLDGLAYTFPVGDATVMVGDNTDISAVFGGACVYSAFTDRLDDCGTGNSLGIGGSGVTFATSYEFENGISIAAGISSNPDSILTEQGSDSVGINFAYNADSWGIAAALTKAEKTSFFGINSHYSWDRASVSGGYEIETTGGTSKSGVFAGLSVTEVGPGDLSIGFGSNANYANNEATKYTYEASYSYPINDGMTITPGIYLQEGAGKDNNNDVTGVAVKTSFSF